ncbi:MAG TPA: MFS transporter [Gaiellaceae bacterium]|nr:MFS transporter [Gaiellaceae bacterium]
MAATAVEIAASEAKTRPGIVFTIVAVGVVLATVDQFVVNIAYTAIARGLSGNLSTVSWVLNGYSIVFAALLVPAGRLADRSGRKRGFLFGVALFTVASAACAASPDLAFLIAARAVQACGAAFLVPSSLGLLLAAYPAERQSGAVGGWMAVTGVSAALGPVVGGLLVAVDWRWIFLVNVPVGALALALGIRLLPTVRQEATRIPDLLGALFLVAATAAVSLGLVQANEWGWGSARIVASFLAAALLVAWFIRRSAVHAAPVVELSLLRTPRFAVSYVAIVFYCAAFSAMLLSVILWAQTAWHWSALESGLAFAPGPVMVPLFSWLSVRLARRFGAGLIAAAGCAVFGGAGLVSDRLQTLAPHYLTAMLPSAIMMGIGVGLAMPTLMAAGAASLPKERYATGSGVLSMGRQLGFTLGVAVFVAVIGTPGHGMHQLRAFQHGWIAVAVIGAAGALVSLALASSDTRGERPAA